MNKRQLYLALVIGLIITGAVLIRIVFRKSEDGAVNLSNKQGSHYLRPKTGTPEKPEEAKGVIVFVHGITGDVLSTWTNDSTKENFARMVAEDAENGRTPFAGYNVYVFGYKSEFLTGSDPIGPVAHQMRNTLQADKVLDHKEIVFVAHSMGGIITRHFLIDNEPLLPKVKFIHLYGTPTNGSAFAKVIAYFSKNPQFDNLREITADGDFNFLETINTDWINKKLVRSVTTFCSYETKPTEVLGLPVALIVPIYNGFVFCTDGLNWLDETHIDMVKPRNRNAKAYTQLQDSFKAPTNPEKYAQHATYGDLAGVQERIMLSLDEIKKRFREQPHAILSRDEPTTDLCEMLQRKNSHVSCYRSSTNEYLVQPRQEFGAGKWEEPKIRKALGILAKVVGAGPVEYSGVIRGYASYSPISCGALEKTLSFWPSNFWMKRGTEKASYELSGRLLDNGASSEGTTTVVCGRSDGQRLIDGNYLLSYARAAWAAQTLAAKLPITGIEAASSDDAPDADSPSDRRVQIKLKPIGKTPRAEPVAADGL